MNKTVFIIATEEGIKIEAKQSLKKDQIEKVEKHFDKVRKFVSDFDNDFTVTCINKNLILGYIMPPVVDPDLINAISKKSEDLMDLTMDFVNKLEKTKPTNGDELDKMCTKKDPDKVIDAAFESIKKAIPNGGAFIMIFDPDSSGIHVAGNLDKNFVLSTLLMNG